MPVMKDARQAAGLSQTELSQRMEALLGNGQPTSQTAISAIERFDRLPPSAAWVDALCQVLPALNRHAFVDEVAQRAGVEAQQEVIFRLARRTAPTGA